MTDTEPGFEIEVASVGEFLRLLKERNEQLPGRQGHGVSGRAIFVAQMVDRRPSNYGFPLVRRYVIAAFAYGRDRVSYTRTTSNAVELPEMVARIEDRQQEVYEEVWAEIRRGLKDSDPDIPVHKSSLRHAADNGRVGVRKEVSVRRSALASSVSSSVSSRSDTRRYSTAVRASHIV